MAHQEDERTTMHGVLDMLVENELEGMADAMATMLNERADACSCRRGPLGGCLSSHLPFGKPPCRLDELASGGSWGGPSGLIRPLRLGAGRGPYRHDCNRPNRFSQKPRFLCRRQVEARSVTMHRIVAPPPDEKYPLSAPALIAFRSLNAGGQERA